ncbi:MAG TPA: hypothetical protein VHF88_09325 [Thermoleophilaceae bacterium]|nr:hypothetical protein [Thermoleophilaceae bacterium]
MQSELAPTSPRRRTPLTAVLALTLAVLALLPAAAAASPTQLSIIQDDATFVYGSGRDPDAAVAEAKMLGADAIRVFVSWHSVAPNQDSRERPPGFDARDPDSPGYRWGMYDALVERARRNGLKLFVALSPSIPYWASEQPSRCPHRIGGYSHLTMSCMWKPSPALFAQFVEAAVKRYGTRAEGPFGGQVALWSLWNEPNLEHYIWPQLKRTRHGIVDLAAVRYRELWLAGWKAIARHDPPSRNKVLFGETAAISSPMDTLYAALCLDEQGDPFKGRLRALHGCKKVKRLPIAGLALHPYNNFAIGSVFTRSFTKDSLPMAYMSRAHKLLDRAARFRRIPPRRGIYVTEFGFQSSPPNPFGDALSLTRHAAAINEADRLFYGDRRVRSIAQYELFDVGNPGEFNTGLRFADGERKPAFEAYRMPLVVTRLDANRVEVWGQVRPASGRTQAVIEIAGTGSVVRRQRTNASGYYRFVLRRAGAARLRYRATWAAPDGETLQSRVAAPGRPIKYRE